MEVREKKKNLGQDTFSNQLVLRLYFITLPIRVPQFSIFPDFRILVEIKVYRISHGMKHNNATNIIIRAFQRKSFTILFSFQ